MEAITVRLPWTYWIEKEWKLIETRTHNRFKGLVGKRIALHSGKIIDKNAFFIARQFLTQEQMDETLLFFGLELVAQDLRPRRNIHPNFGAVTSTAFVKSCRHLTEDDSPEALCHCHDLFGLFLEDIKILPEPIPWKGSLSVFHVPDELINQKMKAA